MLQVESSKMSHLAGKELIFRGQVVFVVVVAQALRCAKAAAAGESWKLQNLSHAWQALTTIIRTLFGCHAQSSISTAF